MNDQDRVTALITLARTANSLAYTAATTLRYMRELEGAHASAPDPRLAMAIPSDSHPSPATAMIQATSTRVTCSCGATIDLAEHELVPCPDCGRVTSADNTQLDILDDPMAREIAEIDKDVRSAARAFERIGARFDKWQPHDAVDPTEEQVEMAEGQLKETGSCKIHRQLGRPDVLIADRYKRLALCRSCGELRALIAQFPQSSGRIDQVLLEVVRQDATKLTTAIMATAFSVVFGHTVLPANVKIPATRNASVRRKQQNLRQSESRT